MKQKSKPQKPVASQSSSSPKTVIRKREGQEPVRVTRMSRSRIFETVFNGHFPL